MTYGNGSYVSYTYDNQNRVKTVKYQDTLTTVTYDYDYLGNIARARVTQPGKEPAAYKYAVSYTHLNYNGNVRKRNETSTCRINNKARSKFDLRCPVL